MQQEKEELNRARDFDLDAWIEGVESTQRTVTVNTRGSLLAKYGKVTGDIEEVTGAIQRLHDALPDDGPDNGSPISAGGEDNAREQFAELAEKRERLIAERNQIADEYDLHKARFTFTAPDLAVQKRLTSEAALKDHKGAQKVDESGIRLMHSALLSIVIVTPDGEIEQELENWTVDRFRRFLGLIGPGMAYSLHKTYLGVASGDVTPPFSQES